MHTGTQITDLSFFERSPTITFDTHTDIGRAQEARPGTAAGQALLQKQPASVHLALLQAKLFVDVYNRRHGTTVERNTGSNALDSRVETHVLRELGN
jgi:hypothetical protein